MSPFTKGLIIGAAAGLAITILGFLPAATSHDRHDMGAAILALNVSYPARWVCGVLGFQLSIERLSATLTIVSALTNMVALGIPFGLVGYCTRFIRKTR